MEKKISNLLNINIKKLLLIKENSYCKIYKAFDEKEKFIIKEYNNNELLVNEIKSIKFYHDVIKNDKDYLDCKVVKYNVENNLFCMNFIEGMPLNECIYKNKKIDGYIFFKIGNLLRKFYLINKEKCSNIDTFYYDYIKYCSSRLQNNILFKSLYVKFDFVNALINKMKSQKCRINFSHGDLVPINIIINNGKLGFIDFANSIFQSNVLNDYYNFYFFINNMLIDKHYKKYIIKNFSEGIGDIFDGIVLKEFFYEYNRLRFFMLKLCSNNPIEWSQFLKGYLTFARPFKYNKNC